MRSRGNRRRAVLRDESGMVSASTVILVAIAVLFGYLLLAAFEGDSAKFGSVPVPGKAAVELPKGAVDISYAEGVDPDAGVDLITPDDLEYSILDPAGNAVPVDLRGEDAKATDSGLARVIGVAQIPAEAVYTVETKSVQTQQRITPALTFGLGTFPAIKERFNGVVESLKGPLGIAVLAFIALLIFLPRFQAARKRSEYR